MDISVQEILKQLVQKLQPHSETSQLEAQLLIAHHLEKPRTWVLAHPEALLSADQSEKVFQSAQRLEDGEALPYVLGHWEFYGLDFELTPAVLIPRPETELLVERAISWLRLHPHLRRVIDVGTGSGCIAIAIAKHITDARLIMTDVSANALKVARWNVEKHGLQDRIALLQADLLPAIVGSFDLMCANLPYIPTNQLDKLPVAKKEPYLALDGGSTGIILIKRLLEQAKSRIGTGGLMMLEIDPAQRDQLFQLAQTNFPADKVRIWQDLSGRDRCLEIEKRFMIFHLCQPQDWETSQLSGEYRPDSLAHEGFIHCSKSDQIMAVANRYYKGVPEMVALTIDPEKLTSEIRWEKSGEIFYPHVYGPINLEAVDNVFKIRPEGDGIYRKIRQPLDQKNRTAP
jgi:release factor glutamine methyltransferase